MVSDELSRPGFVAEKPVGLRKNCCRDFDGRLCLRVCVQVFVYSSTATQRIKYYGFCFWGSDSLGDRHGENILFDSTTGDTVHVDFNCLFDKARTFEVAEKVPFRLTQNLVAGLGVSGVEGVFRKACEVTMMILRNNKESLMSVLETFVHDPLVDWMPTGSKKKVCCLRRGCREVATCIN